MILSWIGLPVKGGGTHFPALTQHGVVISIHPPRVGRDSKSTQKSFSISCTFDKLSRIFRHHILFSGRESKNRRRICQNISAKVSGKSWALPPRTGLYHQGPAGIIAGFHPIVGDLFRIVVSQIIDPQAVFLPVHNGHKFCLSSLAERGSEGAKSSFYFFVLLGTSCTI